MKNFVDGESTEEDEWSFLTSEKTELVEKAIALVRFYRERKSDQAFTDAEVCHARTQFMTFSLAELRYELTDLLENYVLVTPDHKNVLRRKAAAYLLQSRPKIDTWKKFYVNKRKNAPEKEAPASQAHKQSVTTTGGAWCDQDKIMDSRDCQTAAPRKLGGSCLVVKTQRRGVTKRNFAAYVNQQRRVRFDDYIR